MDKRNRLSISFKKEHQHVYEYLKGVSNKSDFIAKALDVYINEDLQSNLSYEEIRKMVLLILHEEGQSPQHLQSPSGKHEISSEDAELLAQLF